MKLTVNPERVMVKAGLMEEDLDEIKITIDEYLPYIQSEIKKECLEDENKLPILNLAATDIVVGYLTRNRANDEMNSDGDLGVGPIKLGAGKSGSSDSRLKRADALLDAAWDMIGDCLIDDNSNKNGMFFGIVQSEY